MPNGFVAASLTHQDWGVIICAVIVALGISRIILHFDKRRIAADVARMGGKLISIKPRFFGRDWALGRFKGPYAGRFGIWGKPLWKQSLWTQYYGAEVCEYNVCYTDKQGIEKNVYARTSFIIGEVKWYEK